MGIFVTNKFSGCPSKTLYRAWYSRQIILISSLTGQLKIKWNIVKNLSTHVLPYELQAVNQVWIEYLGPSALLPSCQSKQKLAFNKFNDQECMNQERSLSWSVNVVPSLMPKLVASIQIQSYSLQIAHHTKASHSISASIHTYNTLVSLTMSEGGSGSPKPSATAYEEALDALSSLITKRNRADKSNSGDRFDLLFDYLKILELEEPISKLKIIHVAGTKGKGSTCTFTESILRNCGFHTGLFTSPHLIDVRERFRLDGQDICEEKFLEYFWWCFHRLKEKTNEDIPMPTYFRFLALLAFKIFAAEQVDVAILEVGLGGKFDATNVVQAPVVCGISSLGYDHMEILGNTLGEIAGEKAGIFKHGTPAFTVPQPDEAMRALVHKATQLDIHLQVAPPLDANLLKGLTLGLEGEHQYLNAGLAVALCTTWLQKTGHAEFTHIELMNSLPEEFIKGLTTACLQGRAQIVPDQYIDIESPRDLVFYLDGAHSPESMDVCARWFSVAIEKDNQQQFLTCKLQDTSQSSHELVPRDLDEKARKKSIQILLFNCMSVRDPQQLLPRLIRSSASHGIHFKKALFVPNTSVYYKVGSHSQVDSQVDLSWQLTLQRLWENLVQTNIEGDEKNRDSVCEELRDDPDICARSGENSAVFSSLPLAIKWLRDSVKRNQSVQFQVLVTGSLHLVGDVLRLINK